MQTCTRKNSHRHTHTHTHAHTRTHAHTHTRAYNHARTRTHTNTRARAHTHTAHKCTQVDALLDELSVTGKLNDRIAATVSAQGAILEEVPVSNLVTPYWHISLSDRVANYKPWGSDYYVIRPDFLAVKIPGDSAASSGITCNAETRILLLAAMISTLVSLF